MLIKRTLAVSLAAALLSATAAMAQTTHTRHHPTAAQQRAAEARAEASEARSSYASQPAQQYQGGPYYYEHDDNGSNWSYYPGYTDDPR